MNVDEHKTDVDVIEFLKSTAHQKEDLINRWMCIHFNFKKLGEEIHLFCQNFSDPFRNLKVSSMWNFSSFRVLVDAHHALLRRLEPFRTKSLDMRNTFFRYCLVNT